MTPKDPILIITATATETKELYALSNKQFGEPERPQVIGKQVVTKLGEVNSTSILHAQCEAGSGGPSGSLVVVGELIGRFRPQCVLQTGICFGLIPDKQKLGDIVVSTHIREYEKARQGEKQIIPRGDRIPCSPKLLGILRAVQREWNECDMYFGVVMSGEKLVDDESFVQKLLEIEPEAVGGEMEGAGLYSASYRNNTDWILFKSIVDWGYKKENYHQEISASLCSEVLMKALTILLNSEG